MALDLLSMPMRLDSLDDLPVELRGLYEIDEDGIFVLTDCARESMQKIAQGIETLANQRNEQQRRAEAAILEQQITGAVLANGSSGVFASAAACLFQSRFKVAIVRGLAVVQTPGGDIPLDAAVREFMSSRGEGKDLARQRATS